MRRAFEFAIICAENPWARIASSALSASSSFPFNKPPAKCAREALCTQGEDRGDFQQ
jgi:hypothetical protein